MKKAKPKNIKRKKTVWLIILGVIVILGLWGGLSMKNVFKEHKEIKSLPLNAVNFTRLKDGTFIGEYEGGMYKWRKNKVQVTVTDGKVSEIKLLSAVFKAEGAIDPVQLYERVIKNQSLQVDVISGATITSKGYLQAVENALLQAEK